MSLYHEAAEILSVPGLYGGNMKSRVFGRKGLKSNASQLYALALETCKWSSVLKEVIENSEILTHERKVFSVRAHVGAVRLTRPKAHANPLPTSGP